MDFPNPYQRGLRGLIEFGGVGKAKKRCYFVQFVSILSIFLLTFVYLYIIFCLSIGHYCFNYFFWGCQMSVKLFVDVSGFDVDSDVADVTDAGVFLPAVGDAVSEYFKGKTGESVDVSVEECGADYLYSRSESYGLTFVAEGLEALGYDEYGDASVSVMKWDILNVIIDVWHEQAFGCNRQVSDFVMA